MTSNALSMHRISKTHGAGPSGVLAVKCASLEIQHGELVALMGPSGCGKSTLLAIAGGLYRSDSGSVTVDGVPIFELPERDLYRYRRAHIGYVFQDYNLISTLTAVENVSLPLELDRIRTSEARRIAQAALDSVGLINEATRFPYELSGGQQQRVAIARAVSRGQPLLLADEPTGALDSEATELLLKLIKEKICGGASGLIVTHDPAVAAVADRLMHMRDGEIFQSKDSRDRLR